MAANPEAATAQNPQANLHAHFAAAAGSTAQVRKRNAKPQTVLHFPVNLIGTNFRQTVQHTVGKGTRENAYSAAFHRS